MKQETFALILAKAKTRKDGVCSFRGVYYAVRGGKVLAFVDNGTLLVNSYLLASAGSVERGKERKRLIEFMKGKEK